MLAGTFDQGRDLLFGERLRKHLPLFGTVDVERGIVRDQFVQQQVTIELAQGRELAGDGTRIHAVAEQVLHQFLQILALRGEDRFVLRGEELRPEFEVAAIGADGERGQPFFHPQVDGEAGQGAILCAGGHG